MTIEAATDWAQDLTKAQCVQHLAFEMVEGREAEKLIHRQVNEIAALEKSRDRWLLVALGCIGILCAQTVI